MLEAVPSGRTGHPWIHTIYQRLVQYFGGHSITHKFVRDFIAECPTCQKVRIGLTNSYKSLSRDLKPLHQRAVVGANNLTITPQDRHGNFGSVVIVNHFTKHTHTKNIVQHQLLMLCSNIIALSAPSIPSLLIRVPNSQEKWLNSYIHGLGYVKDLAWSTDMNQMALKKPTKNTKTLASSCTRRTNCRQLV
jgi:hypothetical protein